MVRDSHSSQSGYISHSTLFIGSFRGDGWAQRPRAFSTSVTTDAGRRAEAVTARATRVTRCLLAGVKGMLGYAAATSVDDKDCRTIGYWDRVNSGVCSSFVALTLRFLFKFESPTRRKIKRKKCVPIKQKSCFVLRSASPAPTIREAH